MNVLLVECDLYRSVGGGQTVYKRLIASNPDVTFYYLGRKETADAVRPPNAKLVSLKETYQVRDLSGEFSEIAIPQWAYNDFLDASNIAAAVADLPIDVVDVPDYRTFGYLLAPALAHHGLRDCRVVLALHGNLSETQRVNWGSQDQIDLTADQREQWQYGAADIRYGISRSYLEHWHEIGGRCGHYLNPLRFVAPPKPVSWQRGQKGVSLNFIGRTEGAKGPDLFVELLAWLPPESYRIARVIGPSAVDEAKISSREHLQRMARARGVNLEQHPSMTVEEMARIYSERGITVLTSRMDTFSLIALESLYAGCPVAISSRAGICRFLRETYPEVPFTPLDIDRLYAGAPAVLEVIADYDRQRDRLIRALESAAPVPTGLELRQIYESPADADGFLRRRAAALYDRLLAFHEHHRARPLQSLTSIGVRVWDALRYHTNTRYKRENPMRDADLWECYRMLFYMPEANVEEVDKKAGFCAEISCGQRVDRARIWAELARLERIRGNDVVAATYDIRVMRALGWDREGTLPVVLAHLREHGYIREAEAAEALYGAREGRLERGRALLASARDGHRHVPDRPFELLEDRRGARIPRVSVIVSLYRAENKLEAFLRMLSHLPWVREGLIEFVFVDSHSPTAEHALFKQVGAALGLSAVYARTSERETIQKAWNRGILLARAPYLAFLGVDEMVRPNCFPALAAELDLDPSLDWVQGSSVMTEVDPNGSHRRDAMLYHRTPYHQDLVYLETSYLSWVGALYRKDIHDRFGFYDETFGAAGDTEFKNRVLPFVKSKTLPMTLGIFLNYPEERATQSPRAELEDLRAWYLHRSPAGVEYAFAQRPPAQALTLFTMALNYRKSYREHLSSDLDFAAVLGEYLAGRISDSSFGRAADSVRRVLQAYRTLDWLPALSTRAALRERERTEKLGAEEAVRVQDALKIGPIAWKVFNDNRYDQHAWPWPAASLKGRHVPGSRARWFRTSRETAAPTRIVERETLPCSEPPRPAADFPALLRRQAEKTQAGHPALAVAIGTVADYFEAVIEGRHPKIPLSSGSGAVLCSVLADSQIGRPLSSAAGFDRAFVELCDAVATSARPVSAELADALEAFALHVGRDLDATQSMAVAARLLTCKTPAEAVQRHRAILSPKVLETLRGAARSAKTKGNVVYSDRLKAYAVAVEKELAAV